MKPRLLFLSQCLPYPPHTGVTNRTYHILKGLAASFDIALLAFTRKNHQATAHETSAACDALASLGVRVHRPFHIRSERSAAARLGVHALALVSGRAHTYFDYNDRDFLRTLREVIHDHRPELVHMDSLDLHRWIPSLGDLPIACTHHSIESHLLRQLAGRQPFALLRAYLNRQAEAIEVVEKSICPRLALNVMMSELDAAHLQRIAPASRTLVVPNGVDVTTMAPRQRGGVASGRVTFLGPCYVRANRDGIEFFLREVWHLVRRVRPDATFQIIGKIADDQRKVFESSPGVSCAGLVADLGSLLAEAECCVVPLRIGGGTRLKVLDAWAMARPVISTSIGCEGLRTEDGGNILIRDTPAGLSAAITRVLADPEFAATIGAAGRRTVETFYSWDGIGSSLSRAYLRLVSRLTSPNAETGGGLLTT
jgi:glycosyltransferase involved in cell wall biosynthesis